MCVEEHVIRPATDGTHWTQPFRLNRELGVDAWIRTDEDRPETLQSVVSRWRIRDRFDSFCAVDAGHTDGLDSRGYYGAVFDGQYVYFSPELQPSAEHGIVLRYDTHRDFTDPGSFEAVDASRTDGLDTRGYYGGAYDGRYVYFTPRQTEGRGHSRVLRYDSRGAFRDSSSWAGFDVGAEQTGQGAAFDGEYVYFCPGYRDREDDPARHCGRVIRYHTKGDFRDPASYQIFDAEGIGGLNVGNFDGGAFDGRYVYFVPLTHRIPLRYDTQGDFLDERSWEAFDAGALGMGMNVGAVFDGRFLYYVHYENGLAVRFDTRGAFSDAECWQTFNAGRTNGLDTRGFDGGFFDGRYVYYVAFLNANESFHGNWLRYDPLQPFDEPGAWTAFDASHVSGLKSYGYNGGAFDGRFFYAAPWRNEWGEAGSREGWDIHGRVLRYDTTGSLATFSLRSCDYGHNGGLCAAVPGPSFLVNTETGARSAAAHRPLSTGWHHLAGVYDGREIRLYVDGECMGRRSASGKLQNNRVPVVIGRIENGLGVFRGTIEQVRLANVARSEEWVRNAYLQKLDSHRK